MSAVLLFVSASPTLAQQYAGTRNSRIGTLGDLDTNKLRSRVANAHILQFGPTGLFAGSEVFSFGSFRPFTFPLPDFSSTNDYLDVSFEEYMDQVASSYGLSLNDYLVQFQFQNAFTAETGYIPQFNEVIQVHQSDFVAGRGFLPFGAPTVPNKPQDDDNGFEPLDPIFRPLPTGDETETDTTTEANLANEIVGGGTLNVDSTGSLTLNGNSVVENSQTVANVAVVPEPATLSLLALGTGMMLGRRRR